MSRLHRGIATVVIGALAAVAQAATVTRGPYLQSGTDTSVVVRWRTDVASDSRVSYGSAPGSLDASVDDPAVKTEHEVVLSGLARETKYYYAVGTTTGNLAGNDATHFFVTAPLRGTPKSTRIWVLGDSGTANSSARAVRDAYDAFTGTRDTDLWLMLGDNAYNSGTDSEYQAAVFDTYPTMLRKSVLWPTLGNHDGGSADSATQSGVYYNIFTLPRNAEAGGVASGTEAYYSFDYGNIHFIVLDSFDSDRSPTGAMLTWVRADLQATAQDWTIAFWHHPPYSKGSHDSDSSSELTDMRRNALPILENEGVDLVLSGHSHSYERSFLLDGHYGTSSSLTAAMKLDAGDGRPGGDGAYEKVTLGPAPHQGAVYTVAGSSGKTGGGPLNHPAMFVSLNILGSLVLDVNGSRLDATFLDSTGGSRDTFTIEKGGGCSSVATVEVSPPSATIEVGATVQLAATPKDAGGSPLTGCGVTWSSDASGIASVSASGLVSGVSTGGATISATSGLVTGVAGITVTVSTNTAPTVDAGPNLISAEGAAVTFAATFTDLDGSDIHTATIAWGDLSPSQVGTVNETSGTGTVTGSHVYADDGNYTVTVAVSDGRGGVGEDSTSAAVSNVPPTASAGGPYSGVAGSPITFTGSGSDPGADPLTFEWDFDFGGSFQVEATGVTVQHTYAQAGPFTVALRVTDDLAPTMATTTVTVASRPPMVLYFSLGSNGTVGGLSVANEDILAFDGNTFSLYFDGSDVGLSSATIDAFTVISPTEILLSFVDSRSVAGIAGTVDDSDIVTFAATSLGANTAGTFSMYFDGSDVGLTTSDEDVDAIELLSGGHLLVSTRGRVSASGVSGAAEDLLEFMPTSLGPTTAGTWALYFDGGDVGLSRTSENVDGVAVDAAGKIYLSTTGSFTVSGRTGADEDVFVFTPTSYGASTAGAFGSALFFDGSVYGLGSNDVFAIDLP